MTAIDGYGGSTDKTFDASGYFRLEHGAERWWLVDPDGGAFISIGVNHTDDTNLKYAHNIDIWNARYQNRQRWIREGLVPDLKDWGFNTIGWVQEYVSGDWGAALDWGVTIDLGHSTQTWSPSDYAAADMPYCLQIRVIDFEDWNGYPSFRDVYSHDFEVYCDYLARSICVDHAQSKNLIGYFLVDIPSWLPHPSGEDFPQLKGLPVGPERDAVLFEVATKYYETMASAIRRYDPNHLILGDRYNGNKGIPEPVLKAMRPYVDVLSVQYFPGCTAADRKQMRDDLARWQAITGKPVIVADIGNWCPTHLNPNRVSPITDQAGRGRDYVEALDAVIHEPWLVGWHWCAYLENTARGWGIKDPYDKPYDDFVGPVREFNKRVYDLA